MNILFFFNEILEIVTQLDTYLLELINEYQHFSYIILFLIIFCETGLIITPFLPGDSLLFALGSILALENISLELEYCILLLTIAAILGDFLNYSIGRWFGKSIMDKNYSLISKNNFIKAELFFNKKGKSSIIIARFAPILRTYVPFIAGMVKMRYKDFVLYNILGAILWINILTLLGYFFGNLSFVKNNFSWVILIIVLISLIPIFSELFFKSKKHKVNS